MADSREFTTAIAEHAAAIESYTPIRAKKGIIVHAVTMHDVQRTACGRRLVGGVIVAQVLTCRQCRAVAGI